MEIWSGITNASQTTEYSATQLVKSINLKLSHAKNVFATNAQQPKSPIRVLSVSVQPPIREWFQAYQTIAQQSHSLPRRSVLGFPDNVVMQTVRRPLAKLMHNFPAL